MDAIRSAYDFGCTLFDTAESYGEEQFHAEHNEQLVGEAVNPFRNDIVLASKFHLRDGEVHGHRGVEESEQSSFGNNWTNR